MQAIRRFDAKHKYVTCVLEAFATRANRGFTFSVTGCQRKVAHARAKLTFISERHKLVLVPASWVEQISTTPPKDAKTEPTESFLCKRTT